MQSFRLDRPDSAQPRRHWFRELLGIFVLCGIAYIGIQHIAHRSPADNSAAVAAESGASNCSSSGYYLRSRLDGSQQVIYDCQFPQRMRCVGEQGGVTSDITAEVRLLFDSTLGADKPLCVS
jgi:hypothetical protein